MASCMAAKKMEEVTPEQMRLDAEVMKQMWEFMEIFIKDVSHFIILSVNVIQNNHVSGTQR